MDNTQATFEDFLLQAGEEFHAFVSDLHQSLLGEGYKCKVESKASGYFVSYAHPKTRRSLLNFLFRKNRLMARIYADHAAQYAEFLHSLPEGMEKEIAKATPCKRLLNPEDCNPKCVMGYDFFVRQNRYQKCRYGCFQFALDAQSVPFVADFVANERALRA